MRGYAWPDVVRILEIGGRMPPTLESLQELARQRRKDLALKYHPDVAADSAGRMQEINALVDWICQLRPVPRRVVRIVYQSSDWSSSTTNTTSGVNFTVSW